MQLTHDLGHRKTTVPDGARLHRARGEQIIVVLRDRWAAATLAEGASLLFCAKPRGKRDTDRLVLVTLTGADYDEESETYRKTFSLDTATARALLGITGSGTTDDVRTAPIDCNMVHIPEEDSEQEQIGDTFELVLDSPTYDPDDVLPDAADGSGIRSVRYDATLGGLIFDTVADGEVFVLASEVPS